MLQWPRPRFQRSEGIYYSQVYSTLIKYCCLDTDFDVGLQVDETQDASPENISQID